MINIIRKKTLMLKVKKKHFNLNSRQCFYSVVIYQYNRQTFSYLTVIEKIA